MSRTSGQQSPASHFRTRASPSEGRSPKSMTENGFYSLICKHFIPTPGKNFPKVLSKLRTKCTTSEKKKVVPVMRVSPLSLLPFQSVENESLTPSVASGHQCHNSKATALLQSSFVSFFERFCPGGSVGRSANASSPWKHFTVCRVPSHTCSPWALP